MQFRLNNIGKRRQWQYYLSLVSNEPRAKHLSTASPCYIVGMHHTRKIAPDNVETAEESATSDTAAGVDTSVEDTNRTGFRTCGYGEEEPVEPQTSLVGSFEDGEEHWNIWGGASRVEGNAQDGNWAVQASSGNGSEQYVTGLRPNTTYRLSGWGKVEGELSMGIGAKNYGGPQKMVNFTTSEYTEGSLTFSTGLSNTSAVIFAYKQ